jgi:hypothetical protein
MPLLLENPLSLPESSPTARAEPLGAEPEFCPNPACRFHDRELAACHQWYLRFGRFHTRARGPIQRFRCSQCGKTCSTQTFSIHYWTHSTNDLTWLLGYLATCSGMRQTGRVAGVTHRVIQNRCRRLARNALALMDCALEELDLRENLAMDGFESFTRSQYHPNNITHITGSRSQFIYAAVHTLLRRKGSMTKEQKRHRELIDAVWKPPRSILADTSDLLTDLAPTIDAACAARVAGKAQPLVLDTDMHSAYPKAIASVPALARRLADGSLHHRRTPSRAPRTRHNPLFAVNYVDRQMRSTMAEYVRETIRQGREVNSQMERTAIFMALHNFATPHRVDGRAWVGDAETHADMAGLSGDRLRRQLERTLTHRHLYSHTSGRHTWIRRLWRHEYENPPSVKLKKGVITERIVALTADRMPRYLIA